MNINSNSTRFSGRVGSPPLDLLLSRLQGVRPRGAAQWQAHCPGPLHQRGDRSPSLAIRELPDGLVLIHCFAGCGAVDIVSAVGLDLADLFPMPDFDPCAPKPRSQPPKFRAAEVLDLAVMEALICALACRALRAGQTLSDEDAARVDLAQETLLRIYAEVRP